MGYSIAAGKFRQVITIQQRADTADGMGGFTTTWGTYAANVRAAMRPYTGKEYWAAGMKQTEASAVFSIRYQAGITQAMRILFGSRVYDIASIINPDEANRELHIMAIERSEGA